MDAERLARPSSAPPPVIDAPPPPVEDPGEAALYQQLFEGESGADALAWGQRARMLAWFRYMDLTADQLAGLAALTEQVAEREATIRAAEQDVAARELAALQPVYADILTGLASPTLPDDETLDALGTALAQAHLDAGEDVLYRVRHDQLRGMLSDTQVWIDSLDEDQQVALGTSRFLLRRQVGALVSPGDHGELLGSAWDGIDFRALLLGRPPTDSKPMDIGGLWATETVRSTPDQRLSVVQRRALTLLAARQPGLVEAIQVARGERDALDGLPQPPPAGEGDGGGEG